MGPLGNRELQRSVNFLLQHPLEHQLHTQLQHKSQTEKTLA